MLDEVPGLRVDTRGRRGYHGLDHTCRERLRYLGLLNRDRECAHQLGETCRDGVIGAELDAAQILQRIYFVSRIDRLRRPGRDEKQAQVLRCQRFRDCRSGCLPKSTRQLVIVRSEEHTSELQSLMRISYAVFCLKKKKKITHTKNKSRLK